MIAVHREDSNDVRASVDAGSSTDNLFNILMKASKEDQAEKGEGLSDEAISGEPNLMIYRPLSLSLRLGNAFVFLIGGHEVCSCLD